MANGQRRMLHLLIDVAKVGALHIGKAALPCSYAVDKDACTNAVGTRISDTMTGTGLVCMHS